MILAWFATVISTSSTPGHCEPFDISLSVQILRFWAKGPPPCNVVCFFLSKVAEVFDQEIDTCTDREMHNTTK